VIPIKKITKHILCCLTAAVVIILFSALSSHAAITLSSPKINAPVNTADGVRVSWNPVTGASQYRVFVNSGGSWKMLADTRDAEYLHKSAVSGTRYSYTVRCLSADGKRYLSGFDSVGKSIYYVSAPVITRLSNESGGVKITWDTVTGAKKYRVYLRNGSSWKAIGDTAAASFTHTAAVSGQTNTYTVRCLSADGKSFLSAYNAGKSIFYIKAPQISAVTDRPDGVQLSWKAVSGAARYRVYLLSDGKWKTLADTKSPYFTHTGAMHEEAYTYTVRCLNASGNPVGAYDTNGKTHRYIIPAVMETPVIRELTNEEDCTLLSWEPVNGAQMYRVMIKQNGSWKKLSDTPDTFYRNTDVKSGDSLTYTVCCISPDGKSRLSAYDTEGVSLTFVSPPKILWSFNTVSGPLIRWNACKGASSYRVMLFKDDTWQILGDTADTMYIHSQAPDKTVCTYSVACLDENGAPISRYYTDVTPVYCNRRNARAIYTQAHFAADIAAILETEPVDASQNAPLTRRTASEVLASALGYKTHREITLSDTGDDSLMTAAYYGYFIPDDNDRIFPDELIDEDEYARLTDEVHRFAQLRGKHILAFGDSIMFGRGNDGSGVAQMTAEKYGMKAISYALNGATFGVCNDRHHIVDEIHRAHNEGQTADVILLDGGSNDTLLISRREPTDVFDPAAPQKSTFASGFEYAMLLIRHYWGDIPVIYFRAHNMNIFSDTLERQIGEYALQLAQSWDAFTVDIYSLSGLNTEDADRRNRYTYFNENLGAPDGIHPNALGYAAFYLPLVSEKLAEILS